MSFETGGSSALHTYTDLETRAGQAFDVLVTTLDIDLRQGGLRVGRDVVEVVQRLGEYSAFLTTYLDFDHTAPSSERVVTTALSFATDLSFQLVRPDPWALSHAKLSGDDGSTDPFSYVRQHSLDYLDERPALAGLTDRYLRTIVAPDEHLIGRQVVGVTLMQIDEGCSLLASQIVDAEFASIIT